MFYRLKGQAANVITLIRIISSILLLFTTPLSEAFFIIYITGGASDMLDGFIARRFRMISRFGASFDSLADLLYIIVMFVIFLPLIPWQGWMLAWIGIITGIRILSLLVGFIRYRALAFLHTYTNKATGLLMFCFPFFYKFLGLSVIVIIICSFAALSAAEELYINLTSVELNRNICSLFHKD